MTHGIVFVVMIYRFADCTLDTDAHELQRDGAVVPVEPQVFELLVLFVRNSGRLVSHDEILSAVWHNRIVSEAAVSSRIAALRRAVGDDGKRQQILRTVSRCGFKFLPTVETREGPARSEAPVRPAPPPAPPPSDDAPRIRVAGSEDGVGIAFAQMGSGPPLLRAGHFLTHLTYDWRSMIWRPLLERLGGHFTLTRYDQRGTGCSDEAGTLDLDGLVADLGAVADAAGLERFPIFAASQGVPVSIAYAARNPDRVSRLVLYGGYARGRSLRGPEEQAMGEALVEMIRAGWGRAGAFADAFATLYAPDASPDQRRDLVAMQLASASAETAIALRRAIDSFDIAHLLPAIAVPTLIVHGRDDAVHPLAQARVLAAGLRNAELHILETRNHVPLPGDPAWEELMRVSIDFLRADA